MSVSLSQPHGIESRLNEIDERLAQLGEDFEQDARAWYSKKKERDKAHAIAYVQGTGGHSERKAAADLAAAEIGWEEEATWEGRKAVLKTLETRSVVGASLLKIQTRLGA